MDKKLHLIMPMGGAGSRFFKNGFVMPKPLIEIEGKPFFYWAAQSIMKFIDVEDITFVILQEHIDKFNIDKEIKKYYPQSKLEIIPEVLAGAVLTCKEGLKNIHDDNPVLFNDCDHMFKCSAFNIDMDNGLSDETFDGGLITFKSNEPQFSYIKYDGDTIVGTIEKKVASSDAICGAYIFKNADTFRVICDEYLNKCEYSEFFVSGMYNIMCDKHMTIKNYSVDYHVPFGTPAEYEAAQGNERFKELM